MADEIVYKKVTRKADKGLEGKVDSLFARIRVNGTLQTSGDRILITTVTGVSRQDERACHLFNTDSKPSWLPKQFELAILV